MSFGAGEYGQGDGTLSRGAGMVRDAMTDFTTISNRLTDQIAAVQGKWGGQGAAAFFVLHQSWTEKQGIIVKALNDFADHLGVTENINLTQDDDVRGNVTLLEARLGN
ncbi:MULTISPECIES: WXG100 family type VII secretion target [Nocardioides]|uniref:WXG100 family type VII secretion target n=1 Tax=Nocardioides TaxID=1839 RepID=UPI00106F258F|nr:MULTISPECIES: WXG100 family type VII secretion target [Nocardioides]QCW49452.1 WXG100 family type VII secretion target [Nocardioides sp. S-1144]